MRRSKEQGEGEDEDRDTPTASSAWEAAMAALEDPATVGGCAQREAIASVVSKKRRTSAGI